MNIRQEKTGELTSLLTIEIVPEDYSERLDKAVKGYQKKASMPGFRPGKVPYGYIKKLYGKALLAEEITHMLPGILDTYARNNQIHYLLQPVLDRDKTRIDMDTQESFVFTYQMAVEPEVDPGLTKDVMAEKYRVKITDEDLDTHIKELCLRHGIESNPETTLSPEDYIYTDLSETDPEGNPIESGLSIPRTFSLKFMKDPFLHDKIAALKPGDTLMLSPDEVNAHAESITGWFDKENEKERLKDFKNCLRVQLRKIVHVDPIPVDKELFDAVYPGSEVEDVESFMIKIRADLEKYYGERSEHLFAHQALDNLIRKANLNLPEDFIRLYMVENQEKELDEAKLDMECKKLSVALRQRLVVRRLFTDNNIVLGDKDVREHIMGRLKKQLGNPVETPEVMRKLGEIVETLMGNEERRNEFEEQVYDEKMKELFLQKMAVREVEIGPRAFEVALFKHQYDIHDEHAG
jgi:trigger factor